MLSVRYAICTVSLGFLPLMAHAAGDVCRAEALATVTMRPTILTPVAVEFASASTQLGGASGVLAQSFDEVLSVDSVLARIRVDGCRASSKLQAPAAAGATDAAYKPQTAFDNTPWRFNMTQEGKRMTADEFDAWMKARGVRVVGKKDAPAAEAPAAAK